LAHPKAIALAKTSFKMHALSLIRSVFGAWKKPASNPVLEPRADINTRNSMESFSKAPILTASALLLGALSVQAQSPASRPIAAQNSALRNLPQTQPGIQNPQVLLPQARFDRIGVLEAWRSDEGWMRGAFKVEKEGDLTFLRVSQTAARITTTAAVPIGAKELALSFKVRSSAIEPGQQEWDVPIISITFFDRFGNEIADGWKAGWRFRQSMPQWQSIARRYTLPPGARVARIEIAHKPQKGTFDVADLKLFDPANAPAGVDVAALGAPLDVSKPLGENAKQKGFPFLDSKRGLGASVNEKNVQVTLHISARAGAGGNGTQAKPLNSLVEAVDIAKGHLNQGRGVRIALQAGLYRLTQERQLLEKNYANAALDLWNWTPQGRDAVLVIEGVGGQAILSGAEEWKPQQWELVDKAKRIYRHAWKENWGFHHAGYYRWNNIRQHRRELVALNGKPLELAMLEDFSYTDPQGRIYDSVGNVIRQDKDVKKEAYTYIGWKGAQVLEPGQFGVAERDDHEGGDSIYLRLPENMTTLDGATVEVGKSRTLMMVNGKNNFVMRNLVFQHAASHYNDYFGKAAFDTGDWLSPKDTHDWVIENCVFRHNNGLGCVFTTSLMSMCAMCAQNTMARRASTPPKYARLVMPTVEVLHNNHRARPAKYYGHGGGGMSLAVRMPFSPIANSTTTTALASAKMSLASASSTFATSSTTTPKACFTKSPGGRFSSRFADHRQRSARILPVECEQRNSR
jgi:hypothetical protein